MKENFTGFSVITSALCRRIFLGSTNYFSRKQSEFLMSAFLQWQSCPLSRSSVRPELRLFLRISTTSMITWQRRGHRAGFYNTIYHLRKTWSINSPIRLANTYPELYSFPVPSCSWTVMLFWSSFPEDSKTLTLHNNYNTKENKIFRNVEYYLFLSPDFASFLATWLFNCEFYTNTVVFIFSRD